MGKCQGFTKMGEKCKRDAMSGKKFCSVHHPTIKIKRRKRRSLATPGCGCGK